MRSFTHHILRPGVWSKMYLSTFFFYRCKHFLIPLQCYASMSFLRLLLADLCLSVLTSYLPPAIFTVAYMTIPFTTSCVFCLDLLLTFYVSSSWFQVFVKYVLFHFCLWSGFRREIGLVTNFSDSLRFYSNTTSFELA